MLVGVGGSVDFVTIANTTQADLTGSQTNAEGNTSITAYSQDYIDGRSGTVGGGGIASIVGAASIHDIHSTTHAHIANGSRPSRVNQDPAFSNAAQNVRVTATDFAEIYGRVGTYSFSLGIGFGASIDIGTIHNDVSASIENNSQTHAGGNINVYAAATHFVTSSVHAFSGAVLGGVAGGLSAIALGGGISSAASAEISTARNVINDPLAVVQQ